MAEALASISGRWHASILAATVGTPPILGDANFFKTRALDDYLDLGLPMFDYRSLNQHVQPIVEQVRQIQNQGETIRAAVLQKALAVSAQYLEAVPEIAYALRQEPLKPTSK